MIINTGIFDISNNNIIYTVNFGYSSGTVICINNTRNSIVTTYSQLSLGLNSITCTATSGANKSTTVINNIIINSVVPLTNIYVLGNGIKNNEYIALYNGSRQYGPYYQANKGCYYVTYFGENLNTNVDGYMVSEHEANYGNHYYNLINLNYISTDANYFVYINENTKYNGLETSLENSGNETIIIKKITISYYGISCP